MGPAEAVPVHATAFVVGDRGVLVFGASGSGKSALAFEAIRDADRTGRFAALIADDRIHLAAIGGRLVARAPAALRSALEVRGAGIRRVDSEPAAVIHLLARLLPLGEAQRYPDPGSEVIEGVELPVLRLPQKDAGGALRAILAHLFLAGWEERADERDLAQGDLAQD